MNRKQALVLNLPTQPPKTPAKPVRPRKADMAVELAGKLLSSYLNNRGFVDNFSKDRVGVIGQHAMRVAVAAIEAIPEEYWND